MQDNSKKMTYSALTVLTFLLLYVVTLYIPLIGILTVWFLPLPITLHRLTYDRKSSLTITAIGIILSMFIGGIGLLPLAFGLGLLGFVIGETVKLGKTKLYTFMASGLTLLITSVITYIVTVLFLNFNIIEVMMKNLRTSQEQITSIMTRYGELPESFEQQLENSITFYGAAIPSIFIISAFGMAFFIVIINIAIAKKVGHKVQNFEPFRNMKLPVIAVWYYLLVLFLPFVVKIESGTTINLIYINATVILRLLFLIQGISLIHYYMNVKKLPKWLTIVSTLFALLLNPVTVLLGVLDAGINIRGWIRKDKK
jgi:uncharacterized protein YybS (DUF2232 family)